MPQAYVPVLAALVVAFALAGESTADADRDASAVIAIESGLAAATPPSNDDMSLADMFKRTSLVRLERDAPGFAWRTYLGDRRPPHTTSLIVQAPAYFTGVARLASERPMSEWRAYLRWRLLATNSPFT